MARSKKVVIIRNAAPADFGGGERFPIFLATALKSAGWEAVVLGRSKKLLDFAHKSNVLTVKGWWWKKQRWSGPHVFLTPFYFVWQLILFFYYIAIFLRLQPQVVHIQSKDDFIAGTFAARLAGAKVIWTDHADLKHVWQNLNVWYKNPIGKAVKFAAKRTHAITVVSQSEKKLVSVHLSKSSPIREKITVIYNGAFDQKDHYPAISQKNTIRFIVASRLVYDKGIKEVIQAYDMLQKELSNSRLTIIGDGPDSIELQQIPGAEKVRFPGHSDDPLRALSDADIFIHPTYHEGFSVALVEASMMSLAIIATNVGGNPEIIHDKETGILIPARNTDALYQAMKSLANDNDARRLYAKNAREQYIKKFEFNTIVADYFIPLYNRGNQ